MEGGVSEGRGSLNGPLFFALDVVTNVFRFVVVMFEKILFSLFLCVVSFHDMLLLLLLSLLSLCSCPFLFLFHSFIHSFIHPTQSLIVFTPFGFSEHVCNVMILSNVKDIHLQLPSFFFLRKKIEESFFFFFYLHRFGHAFILFLCLLS